MLLFIWRQNHFNFLILILLILSVDIFMIGYLINSKVGAYTYNLGHSYIVPSILVFVYLLTASRPILAIALIWVAHIALDRTLGYGLKTDQGFKYTHLGKLAVKK
jgi:hypothetical protein